MNQKELVKAISKASGVTQKETAKVINAFKEVATHELEYSGYVRLVGFGTFKVKHRAGRPGVNPMTGEVIQIEGYDAPVFKAAKALKDIVR